MKNKLLLTLICIATSLQVFAYSPFLDARYSSVDISTLAQRYAAMNADSSILSTDAAVVKEAQKIVPKQENLVSSIVFAQPSLDSQKLNKKHLDSKKDFYGEYKDKAKNSSPKSTNFNNFASHVAQPVTASTIKPIVVNQAPMIKKVVLPLAAFGGLKLAYDSFKSQQAFAPEMQKGTEIGGNNFKMASAIGITVSLFAYGAYKLSQRYFAESKKVTEQN